MNKNNIEQEHKDCFSTDDCQLENKWRENFESKWKKDNPLTVHPCFGKEMTLRDAEGKYKHQFVEHQWGGYLDACKTAQVGFEKQNKLLEQALWLFGENLSGYIISEKSRQWIKDYEELKCL